MFIVSVNVRSWVPLFQFWDWLFGFFVLSLLVFSCSVTILGLGSFLVSVLLVLYFYFLEVPQFILPMHYDTSNCNWTFYELRCADLVLYACG